MKKRNTLLTLGVALFAAAATAGGNHADGGGHDDSAIGQPGQATKVTRTVQVDMADTMHFTPANIAVKQGETIRFVVKNSGRVKHEFVLGIEKKLKEHYEQMKKFPDMEHADSNMVTVAPGQTGEVIWQFTKAGPVNFACLYPGHYDAGMKGLIKVTGDKSKRKENEHDHTH
jgi:uncharacterized cupredoxin-like copper-binding protein